MSKIEENSFQLARFFVDHGLGPLPYNWGEVRQELNLSNEDFEKAYKHLNIAGCCRMGGQPGDDFNAIIYTDIGIIDYYNRAKIERADLSRDAEQLLNFLVTNQDPGFPFSIANAIMKKFDWKEKRYTEAAQILDDEGFVTGDYAAGNPFYKISSTSEGRKLVRRNFRISTSPASNVDARQFTTNIHGNNNIVNTASILDSVTQSVQANTNLSEPDKDTLNSLLEQLNIALKEMPKENADDAEAVAETAKTLIERATKEKPNKRLIEISSDGLKGAAQNIAAITPSVLLAAQAIIVFIQSFSK
jgi:hypothetical protein